MKQCVSGMNKNLPTCLSTYLPTYLPRHPPRQIGTVTAIHNSHRHRIVSITASKTCPIWLKDSRRRA